MSTGRVAASLLVSALLSACAVAPITSTPPKEAGLSGRLSVRVDAFGGEAARSVNATFELKGDARTGSLDLATPLGTVLAQARWAPGQVVLATTEGETMYDNLDALTREVLGESVPVVALFDWLRGRPWEGAVSTSLLQPSQAGFVQLGWSIDLSRFDEAWFSAQRALPPVVTVRAKLDRP